MNVLPYLGHVPFKSLGVQFFGILFNTYANLFFLLNASFGLIWLIDYLADQDNFIPPDEVYFSVLTTLALIFKVLLSFVI